MCYMCVCVCACARILSNFKNDTFSYSQEMPGLLALVSCLYMYLYLTIVISCHYLQYMYFSK